MKRKELGKKTKKTQDDEKSEEKIKEVPHRPAPKYSTRERQTRKYFLDKRMYKLLHFLMEHLIVNRPDDPLAYLADLMDKCMLYRSGVIKEPPTVYNDHHIASMFTALDPAGTSRITKRQYFKGMQTLGIESVPLEPPVDEYSLVHRQTFEYIAKDAMIGTLMELIRLEEPSPSTVDKAECEGREEIRLEPEQSSIETSEGVTLGQEIERSTLLSTVKGDQEPNGPLELRPCPGAAPIKRLYHPDKP